MYKSMDFSLKKSLKTLTSFNNSTSKHSMKTIEEEENSSLLINSPKSLSRKDTILSSEIQKESTSSLISSRGDVCLDMDLEMKQLNQANTPREVQVSFHPSPEIQEQHATSGEGVIKCSSNASFGNSNNASLLNRKSGLMNAKTPRSRLMDPPADVLDRKSGRVSVKSGQLKSGRNCENDDDDESLWDDDIPDGYKAGKVSFWVWFEWLCLVLIVGVLVCTLVVPFLRGKKLWDLYWWKWEVLVLVLICGRLVSSWVVRVVVFLIERNFLLRKRVVYFVYGMRKSVQMCMWFGFVLLAWHFLFDDRVTREANIKVVRYATKFLWCLLVATILWLLKTLVIKVLASSFHVSTYFDRIQESLFNQYVIETLSGPPLVEMKRVEEDNRQTKEHMMRLERLGLIVPPELRETAGLSPKTAGPSPKTADSRVMGTSSLQKSPLGKSSTLSLESSKKEDEGVPVHLLHRLNPKNISAWNMKRLMKIVRNGGLNTLDEQLEGAADEDENATQIRSENEAKAAAKKIFINVAKPGVKYISLVDLKRFLPEDEALKTLSLFEGAFESGKISKKTLKDWVVNAFRERRALALTLNDTKTAINKLHRFVNGLVGVIIIVISLLVFGIATSKFIIYMSSQVLLVAFIFGNTCKTIFEAIIFLFVMHPFDVGDRCEIDGVQLVVEEMNILNTVFLRYDNQKITYPNSTLATKAIGNFYRSPDMGDAVEFSIHVATPAEKIGAIKQRIASYIENSKNDHWFPAPMIVLKDFEELDRVRIAVWLTQRMNFQDMGERYTRRALLLEEMLKIFKELDIDYRLLPLPINVLSMPPLTSERLPPTWTPNA